MYIINITDGMLPKNELKTTKLKFLSSFHIQMMFTRIFIHFKIFKNENEEVEKVEIQIYLNYFKLFNSTSGHIRVCNEFQNIYPDCREDLVLNSNKKSVRLFHF